jgi:hypothetical protein
VIGWPRGHSHASNPRSRSSPPTPSIGQWCLMRSRPASRRSPLPPRPSTLATPTTDFGPPTYVADNTSAAGFLLGDLAPLQAVGQSRRVGLRSQGRRPGGAPGYRPAILAILRRRPPASRPPVHRQRRRTRHPRYSPRTSTMRPHTPVVISRADVVTPTPESPRSGPGGGSGPDGRCLAGAKHKPTLLQRPQHPGRIGLARLRLSARPPLALRLSHAAVGSRASARGPTACAAPGARRRRGRARTRRRLRLFQRQVTGVQPVAAPVRLGDDGSGVLGRSMLVRLAIWAPLTPSRASCSMPRTISVSHSDAVDVVHRHAGARSGVKDGSSVPARPYTRPYRRCPGASEGVHEVPEGLTTSGNVDWHG